jgi:hypothetical protein
MPSQVVTATVEPHLHSVKVSQEKTSSTQEHEDNFFWAYTEEPHRTRRQAIIKAHPEVRTMDRHRNFSLTSFPGHQTLRPRTTDQIRRPRRRITTINMRHPPPLYTNPLRPIPFNSLHNRCNRKPEPLPLHPRNLPQPRLPQPSLQSPLCNLCKPPHRDPILCGFQTISSNAP